MSFHRRRIDNDNVIETYKRLGLNGVIQLYESGVDAVITQIGVASEIGSIIETNHPKKYQQLEDHIKKYIK